VCSVVEGATGTFENTRHPSERGHTLWLRVICSTSALTQSSDRRENDGTSDIVANGAAIACAHDVDVAEEV